MAPKSGRPDFGAWLLRMRSETETTIRCLL
jgi:hypothetical protein